MRFKWVYVCLLLVVSLSRERRTLFSAWKKEIKIYTRGWPRGLVQIFVDKSLKLGLYSEALKKDVDLSLSRLPLSKGIFRLCERQVIKIVVKCIFWNGDLKQKFGDGHVTTSVIWYNEAQDNFGHHSIL